MEDSVENTITKKGGSIPLLDNIYKAQKEKRLPVPVRSEKQNSQKEWKISKDHKQFCICTK